MKRNIFRREKAVSPVIATILMVAITVVLAATLYMMLPGAEDADRLVAMSGESRRVTNPWQGWLIEIHAGSVPYLDGEALILYHLDNGTIIPDREEGTPPDGDYDPVEDGTFYYDFGDNNDNDRVDKGDTIRIYDPEGTLVDRYQLRIKGTNLRVTLTTN